MSLCIDELNFALSKTYIVGTACFAELGGFAAPPASSFFFTFLGCELWTERVGAGGGGAEVAAALLEEAELLLPLLPPLPEKKCYHTICE